MVAVFGLICRDLLTALNRTVERCHFADKIKTQINHEQKNTGIRHTSTITSGRPEPDEVKDWWDFGGWRSSSCVCYCFFLACDYVNAEEGMDIGRWGWGFVHLLFLASFTYIWNLVDLIGSHIITLKFILYYYQTQWLYAGSIKYLSRPSQFEAMLRSNRKGILSSLASFFFL